MADNGTFGWLDPMAFGHEFNQQFFFIKQLLGRMRTMQLVKVISCTASGAVDKPGTVNVQPIVNQVDGAGNTEAHGTIYNLQYVRWQSGSNAIIADPQKDDIGLIVIADRDSKSGVAAGGAASPGSSRRFSPSDGVYLGTVAGKAAPTRYVQFDSHGVHVGANDEVECIIPSVPMVCRVTPTQVILGNPNKPLYAVDTEGGPSTCVVASLEA